MDNFNFKEELEDQKKEFVEQYGVEIASYHWNGEDYYDGEYCNPPSYRWSSHLMTVCWSHMVSWIFCSCPNQLMNWHKICRFLLVLVYNEHMSTITEFYSGLLDKGYTEREIRESCKRHQQRVAPDWFNGTYAEYLDAMHDYLNGL